MTTKHIKKSNEAAQSAKLHRLGATGSLKMAKKAEHAPRKYRAAGGSAGDDSPGDIDGAMARQNLSRPGRGKKGKDKKGGTNVNVIIMPKADNANAAPPMMPPMGAGPGPGPMPPRPMPGPGPMMPPPGAGGPPLPMRKHGGKVRRAHKEDGGPTTKYRQMKNEKANDYDTAGVSNGLTGIFTGSGDMLKRASGNFRTADDLRGKGAAVEDLVNRARGDDLRSRVFGPNYKKGGKVHPDEAEDKKLLKRMVKGSCLKK